MIENNRLDRSFGSVGTSAGILLVLVGVIASFMYPSALVLVLIGGFVGFTDTSTLINYDKKQVKFCNNIFGFIPVGKWMSLENSMKIGIKESNLTYRAFSRGNRALDITRNDFRLVLMDTNNREVMPLKKTHTLEVAKIELETMAKKLGLVTV